jgi:DNA-3-methyladenine glycosylase
MKILPHSFFQRKTLIVAKDLLGKYLVRNIDGKIVREKITEVEAYIGPHDLASHSSKGRTKRTEAMHASGGTIYVYFIYGMYHMLNIVTETKDYPAGILIRGTEKVSGPGRVAREFKIDKNLYGKPLGKITGLWIEEGEKISPKDILKTPRIGIDYAGAWAKKPYRFVLKA